MDIEYECRFIKNAIAKKRVDRVCYELSIKNKRKCAIERFHNPYEIVNTKKSIDIITFQPEKIYELLKKNY